MADSPKISVIIPVKNRADLLSITLDSILRQSLKPYEIIVVDDNSDDDLQKIIVKYSQHVIFLNSEGTGPGAARNTALKIASGDYIKYFDSDDLMTSNTLEVQHMRIQKDNSDLVYSSYFQAKLHHDTGWEAIDNVILHYYPFSNSRSLNHWMCRGLFIPLPNTLIKKEVLKDVGPWRTDVKAYEDFDYLWRIGLQTSNITHSNQCAFLYRIHGNQTTENHFNDVQRDKDKLMVFGNILQNYFPPSLSWLDKQSLCSKISSMPGYSSLTKHNVQDRILRFYFHANDKIGRIKTKTKWQPYIGPLNSKDKIDQFLQLLN